MDRKTLIKRIANLPRDTREQLLEDIDAARRHKQAAALEFYNNPAFIGEAKVHKIQQAFHKDQSKIRLFFGGNRCLAGSTPIATPDRGLVRLDCLKEGDTVLTVDPDSRRIAPCPISEVFSNGQQAVQEYKYSIPGQGTKTIRLTPNHYVLTAFGMYSAGDVPPFTEISVPDMQPVGGLPDHDAFLLGLLIPVSRLNGIRPEARLGAADLSLAKRLLRRHKLPSTLIRIGELVEIYGDLAKQLREANAAPDYFWQHKLALWDQASLEGFLAGLCRYGLEFGRRGAHFKLGLGLTADSLNNILQAFSINASYSALDARSAILKLMGLRLPVETIKALEKALLRLPEGIQKRPVWLGPTKARPRLEETYDLKLAGGHNLFVANGLISGNSGKTEAGVVECIWWATGTHPYRDVKVPNNGRIIVESLELLEQDLVPKLRKWAPNFAAWEPIKGHQGKIAGWRLPNGSRIDAFTFNQESAKLEGVSISWLYVNEPPPREHIVASRRGLIDQDGSMWMTLTPLSEPWLYNDMVLPLKTGKLGSAALFEATPYDNPWLSKEAVDAWAASLDPEEKEARIYGRFRHLTGRVFKKFDTSIHVIPTADWPTDWGVTVGIDPHLRKDQIAVFLGQTKAGWYVALAEVAYSGDSLEEFAQRIAETAIDRGFNIQRIMADSFLQQPDMVRRDIEPKKIMDEAFARMGLPRVEIAKKKYTVQPFIAEMKRLLEVVEWPMLAPNKDGSPYKGPSFYVMDCCQGLISDFMSYVYQVNRRPELSGVSENPIKKHDDFLDSLKYSLLADPYIEARYRRPSIPISLDTYIGRFRNK